MENNLSSYTTDKLQQKGHYYFSENISLMMPGAYSRVTVSVPLLTFAIGSLHKAENANESLPRPKHLLFTPGGRISIVSQCQESNGMLLHNVQRNLNAALKRDYYDVLAYVPISFFPVNLTDRRPGGGHLK
jgi:hypothetical protein